MRVEGVSPVVRKQGGWDGRQRTGAEIDGNVNQEETVDQKDVDRPAE